MDTFVESNDFDGITMIPFCTSGSSDIGDSGKNLEKQAGAGEWLSGDRLQGRDCRTFLVVGDGEAEEGQVWEAAMFTAAKKLTNLVWIIDWNKKQLDGYIKDINDPGDYRAKFEAFGFDAVTIDGHDVEKLYEALTKKAEDKPIAIILDSVKGKGVTAVEQTMANHSMKGGQEMFDGWLAELREKQAAMKA